MGTTPYLPIIWASDICVDVGSEKLFVMGKEPMMELEKEGRRDPYLQYLSSVNWQFGEKRTGGKSPHIRFANADSDDKLITFVQDFGPVAASVVTVVQADSDQTKQLDEEAQDWRSTIAAFEDLATLRRERLIYIAALGLLAELKKGRIGTRIEAIRCHVAEIVEGVRHWPEQCEKERKWRVAQGDTSQMWHFDSSFLDDFIGWQWYVNRDATSPFAPDAFNSAFSILCSLINSFKTRVDHLNGHAVETLPLFSLRWGIRPALYLILKSEYLSRGATAVCANDRCSRFFSRERAGGRFCGAACSRQSRQRKYWAETGAAKRAKRRKAQEKSRRGRRSKR